MSIRLLALMLALAGESAAWTPAAAAATVATPATIDAVLARAGDGDTITLAAGTYDKLRLRDRHWSTPVTIDATAANLLSIRFDNVSGLTWHGGTFDGGDVAEGGFKIELSNHIVIDGATFHHFTSYGVALGNSQDARITDNLVTDSGSDGFDVAISQRVVLDHNRCTDSHPLPGAHPDCIQLWSKPGKPPTADIVVSNNTVIGDTQGFTAFNHVINGVDDGGFDRVTIENNYAKVTNWHGVALYDCRNCIVRHNRAESLPNPKYPNSRAWIKVQGGVDVLNCDNRAADYPDDPGRKRCKADTRDR